MKKINDYSLYLVISEEYGNGRSALEIAKSAISGGVDMIQMREKTRSPEELVRMGRELSRTCKEAGVTFIVNDEAVLAKEVDADGVHLGQDDISRFFINDARRILGRDKIIGLSTQSLAQFEKANRSDVDYIAFGPIFKTKIKDFFVGTNDVEKVMSLARKPVFFIGGIKLSNIEELLSKGAKNIALIRAITEADHIASATKAFKDKLLRKRVNF